MKIKFLFYSLLFILSSSSLQAQSIFYVDINATGSNNGTSWTNAYADLQDAIDIASPGDELWIAQGTYHPTRVPAGSGATSAKDYAFHFDEDLKLYGGFKGTETALSQRNPSAYITILSGDLNNDDAVSGSGQGLTFSNRSENVYHVVMTANTSNKALLDGVTIIGGHGITTVSNLNYSGQTFFRSHGGGLTIDQSKLIINNVIFKHNFSNWGGSLHVNNYSEPTITKSIFNTNKASFGGGILVSNFSLVKMYDCKLEYNVANSESGGIRAMVNAVSIIDNCTFLKNNAMNRGAGISSSPSTIHRNCTFQSNYTTASEGGGAFSGGTFENCLFDGNSASSGAGVYTLNRGDFINCVFTNNDARGGLGGGIHKSGRNSTLNVINCTFFDNRTTTGNGGGISASYGTTNIQNSILWDNTGEIQRIAAFSTVNITNSLIAGSNGSGASWNTAYGTDGGNNLDVAPSFVNSAAGVLSLNLGSPALDVGNNSFNSTTTDIAGDPRISNSIIDMGAYEYFTIDTSHTVYCCDNDNLIQNGDFESSGGFTSAYQNYNGTEIVPGEYAVIDFNDATSLCQNWEIKDHTYCINGHNNKIMVVNGQTQKGNNLNHTIWETTVTSNIERDSQYQFCGYVKHLPQCCFDIVPEIRIQVRQQTGNWTTLQNWTSITYTGSSAAPCDWERIGGIITTTGNTLSIRVQIRETGNGDGNDLALDDLFLGRLQQNNAFFSMKDEPIAGSLSNYELTASVNTLLNTDDILNSSDCKYRWTIAEVSNPNNPLQSNSWSNIATGGTATGVTYSGWGLTTDFTGYNSPTSGIFDYGKWYIVSLEILECDCAADIQKYQVLYNGQ